MYDDRMYEYEAPEDEHCKACGERLEVQNDKTIWCACDFFANDEARIPDGWDVSAETLYALANETRIELRRAA
jgi:hypothetical protein